MSFLPISKQLGTSANLSFSKKEKKLALDEQIAALERELAEKEQEDEDEDEDEDDLLLVERDEAGNVLRISSALTNERIAPLPATCLPAATCGKQRNFSEGKKTTKKKSKVRFVEVGSDEQGEEEPLMKKNKTSGLEATIREIFQSQSINALASSSNGEKVPFRCRTCNFIGQNEEEFVEHRASEFHKTAVQMATKLNNCRLCKKQFNSLAQKQEHLSSKAHADALAAAKASAKSNKKFR